MAAIQPLFVEGDTSPDLTGVVTYGGAAVNLTGATVVLRMKRPDATILTRTATVTNAAAGAWSYAWQDGELTKGTWWVDIEATAADSSLQTFPVEVSMAFKVRARQSGGTGVVTPVPQISLDLSNLTGMDAAIAGKVGTPGSATDMSLKSTYVPGAELTERVIGSKLGPRAVAARHADAPLTTPTYDATGQAVHPSVWDFGEGNTFGGYRYWMAMTPYPGGVDVTEQPSILASADGLTWVVPAGLTNPIDTAPVGFYPDPDLIYFNGLLWCTYAAVYCKSSADGVTWSARTPMSGIAAIANRVSQTVCEHDGLIHYWVVATDSNPNDILRRSAPAVAGPYTAPTACTVTGVPSNKDVWHIQIKRVGSTYVGVFALCDSGTSGTNSALHFATSTDGDNWTVNPDPLLMKAKTGWTTQQVYRSAFWPREGRDGVLFDLWYSAAATPNTWRIGYTQIKEAPAQLPQIALSTFGDNAALFGLITGNPGVPAVNTVIQTKIIPRRDITVTALMWFSFTLGANYDIGIVDDLDKVLWSKGATVWPAPGTITETVPNIVLRAGRVYRLAFASDTTAGQFRGIQASATDMLRTLDGGWASTFASSGYPIPTTTLPQGSSASTRQPLIIIQGT